MGVKSIDECRQSVLDLRSKYTFNIEERDKLKVRKLAETENRADLIDAREIMSAVGILAQEELKDVLESLVTEALRAVFNESYAFVVEDTVQRNKPETNFFVMADGNKLSLRDELGCGVLDVISFVLRVVLWASAADKTRNTMILDEPAKFVSRDRRQAFGDMMRKISSLLSIQFILVTHEPEFIEIADKAYSVENNDGISSVVEV